MQTPFTFAGFQFPRSVAIIRPRRARRLLVKGAKALGSYSTAPTPGAESASFYLDFAPGLRWEWADHVEDVRLSHTGWFTSDVGHGGDKIRGLVMRLPKGRGFLAGWSMGEHMASGVETDQIHETAFLAAHAADSIAERMAEAERDRERAYQAGAKFAELGERIAATRADVLAILTERHKVKGLETPALCAAVTSQVRQGLEKVRTWRDRRAGLLQSVYRDQYDVFNEGAGFEALA